MLAASQTGFREAQAGEVQNVFIYWLFLIWLMWKEPQPVIIKGIIEKKQKKEDRKKVRKKNR